MTFTFNADLPGEPTTPATGTADGEQTLTWSVPLDGTPAELTSVSVIAQGTPSSVWGTVATIALVALVAWCVLAVAFIAFVARARKRRAHHHRTV